MTLNRTAFIHQAPEIKEELLLLFSPTQAIKIFDIGACEGEDAVRYSFLFPNATVYLFEPRPDNLKMVAKNIEAFNRTNIVVSDLALSSENGKATFYLSSGQPQEEGAAGDWDFGNKSSSLLPPGEEMKRQTEWLKFENTLEVSTQRLEDYCKQLDISSIDFIHMDVQGAELMVLHGAGNMIENISAVWLEVEAVELYKGQPIKQDVEKFMEQHDFICVKSTVGSVAGDQLYVNKKIVSPETIKQLIQHETKSQRIKKLKRVYYRLRNKLTGK